MKDHPGMPCELKAVVFDLDDTLVQSTVNYGKFKSLVIDRICSYGEERGLYRPTETIVSIIGRYEQRIRAQGVPEDEVRRRLAEFDRIMDAVELEEVHLTAPIRGARELLLMLREKRIGIGVLTRGCEEYARKALGAAGLLDLVDVIESRNSTTKAKPDPEAYHRVVEKLGVPVDATVLVGDHPIDALCASNAGVPFIGMLTGDVPEEELRKVGSVEIFADAAALAEWFRARPHD